MFLYVSVFGLSCLLMYLYQESTDINKNMFYLFTVFSLLFLLLALRYETGGDYINYTNILNEAKKTNNYFCFEIGWVPLVFLIVRFNMSPHFFFVFTAFVSTLLIIKSIPKKNACVGICLYLALGYIETFSAVRQCFGAVIFAYAYSRYRKNDNFVQLLIFTFIAAMFHKSFYFVILCVFVSVFFRKKVCISEYRTLLYFFILFIIFNFINLADLILHNLLAYTPYAVYANMGEAILGKTENTLGIGMLLRYVLCFLLLFDYSELHKKYLTSHEIQNNFLIIVLYCFFLLSNQMLIFMRLPLLFNTCLAVFYENKRSKIRHLQNLLMIFLCFLLFYATLLKSSKSVEGSWKLIPYTSILSQL